MYISEATREKFTNVSNVSKDDLTNVNNVSKAKERAYSYNIREVQQTAFILSEKLHDTTSFEFFCKVAWNLPPSAIWGNLEQALKGKNPRAYFTFLCKLSMDKPLS